MLSIDFYSKLVELETHLRYYALSLTQNKEQANDLVQETFLKALVYSNKFAADTNLKAWLYTIMKNTFINEYRKAQKMKNTMTDSNKEFFMNLSKDVAYPSPESFYSSNEIENNILKLDEEYRVPFKMFLDGYKYKEISNHLNLPLGTVKSRIFFTRKKLSVRLKDYETI